MDVVHSLAAQVVGYAAAAVAAAALHDDRLVRRNFFQAIGYVVHRDKERAGDVAAIPLRLLAHIEDHHVGLRAQGGGCLYINVAR